MNVLCHVSLWKHGITKICKHEKFWETISRSCISQLVPIKPQWHYTEPSEFPPKTILSAEDMDYLESVSLVQHKNTAAEKAKLENIIRLADTLQVLDTSNVEPMVFIFENESLHLRSDESIEQCSAKDALKNAKVVTENYFVAPPGNISMLDSKIS